ncbi:hypothetical protein TIFTF001_034103 [Ficus carica]|uniref:Uncharacterized protein n=1 Tax=Ficus carica TaxID=3494 RepID=A0AA88E6N3_FICCA|nr:hypothetical protein TIFTF001_034103 [Ficus carica]
MGRCVRVYHRGAGTRLVFAMSFVIGIQFSGSWASGEKVRGCVMGREQASSGFFHNGATNCGVM